MILGEVLAERRRIERRLREVLREHWPTLICDHEAKTDRAQCSCCSYEPPVTPTVGAAVETWIDHLIEELRKS